MKILIADDHWVVREALKQVMTRISRAFEPLEASSFEEVRALLNEHPDVELMLVDLIMPGFEEFEGLKTLRVEFPEIPVVVVSVHEDIDHVLTSISHGVIGYIPKSAGAEDIIRALTRVLSGEVAFPRHILEGSRGPAQVQTAQAVEAEEAPAALATLTEREQHILALLGQGFPISRVAQQLSISPNTVRTHVSNIMKKLRIRNRSEMIHYAINVASKQ